MERFVIVDVETSDFDIESGIYEVSALFVENMEIKDRIHIGIVSNESIIKFGYGIGYEEISCNDDCIYKFKSFLKEYNYPIVAHNASFDRKFLVHYGWIDEDYEVYDTIRAIKYEIPYLFSYALDYLMEYFDIKIDNRHTATGDTEALFTILKIVSPKKWIPLGASSKQKRTRAYQSQKEKIDLNKINIVSEKFKDKNIVFTGKGPYKRDFLKVLAMKHSANILNGVTKKTDILVVGEEPGSKLKKAKDLGIDIVSIDDFMDLVQDTEMDYEFTIKPKNKPIRTSSKSFEIVSDNRCLENCLVSLIPMRLKLAEKVGNIIESMGGEYITSFRMNETNLLVYESYGEDFTTVDKAKSKGVKTMKLSEFNRMLVDNL